jgi:hypothetical protein
MLRSLASHYLPARLRKIAPLVSGTASATRTVKLGFKLSLRRGFDLVIDGERHLHDAPVNVGELQVWDVVNTTMMDHPFHLDGVGRTCGGFGPAESGRRGISLRSRHRHLLEERHLDPGEEGQLPVLLVEAHRHPVLVPVEGRRPNPLRFPAVGTPRRPEVDLVPGLETVHPSFRSLCLPILAQTLGIAPDVGICVRERMYPR